MNMKNNQAKRPETCFECDAPVHTEWHHHTFPYGVDDSAVELTAHVPVEVCQKCGFASLGYRAEELMHEAVCAHHGVLTPREIRAIRKRHRLSRAAFAEFTGLGEATLHRWENGILIQNRANDNFLRLLARGDNMLTLRRSGTGTETPWQPQFRELVPESEVRKHQAAYQLRVAA